MIPRDFKVAPSECFLHPNAEVFTEYTVLRGWLSQWLKYVHWYAKVAMSSDLSLESFFDDPVVESNWRLTGTDARGVRFAYLWKLFYMVAKMPQGPRTPILAPPF